MPSKLLMHEEVVDVESMAWAKLASGAKMAGLRLIAYRNSQVSDDWHNSKRIYEKPLFRKIIAASKPTIRSSQS